jgi:hypothetical protein
VRARVNAFKFSGTTQYVFNFAAFGVVRSGSPDCTVTGPRSTPE